MNGNFRLFSGDKPIRAAALSSFFLIFLTGVLIFFFQQKMPPYIPFFNSMPWGEERLFGAFITILFPLFFLIIFILNNTLATLLYKRYTIVARILSFNSFLFIFLGLLAYIQIVLLVF